jgi:hypothetical protein
MELLARLRALASNLERADYEDLSPDKKRQKRGKGTRKERKKRHPHDEPGEAGCGERADARQLRVVEGNSSETGVDP